MISLLCWNVAGRVQRLDEQAQLVSDLGSDIVCLQEVSPRTAPIWTGRLQGAGWPHVVVADTEAALASHRRRPLSVLIAARQPLVPNAVPGLPWPERGLSAQVGGLEMVNVHSPVSPSPGLAKVLTHEVLHGYLAGRTGPVALCGDLNTPREEHPDGRVWTFARDQHGHLRPERGERWDTAELALIKGLEPHGYRDAFRDLYGRERRELSGEWPWWGGGYRLDHLVVNELVDVSEVVYLHAWRKRGLSDHSPLMAQLAPRTSS